MRRLFLLALALTILVPLLVVVLVLADVSATEADCGAGLFSGASGPVGGVPQQLIPLYQGASARYRLGARGPSILAAINYVETDFGQNLSTSSAGAVGWMQFEPSSWAQYGVTPDGSKAPFGPAGWNNPADAIYSAANLLQASGAPGNWPGAIFDYNHASWYVQEVLSHAAGYYTQGLTANGSSSTGARSGAASTGTPFTVPPASNDPAGLITLTQGQPTIVAATMFTDRTGAWGDDLTVSTDSYAELSPGIPGSLVTKQNATMLGGLAYMTPLQVTNPQNGRSVILYKRDIGAGQPLSSTLDGYHYRIDLTAWADQQLGLSGSGLLQVTLLNGPVDMPGAAPACSTFAPTGSGRDPIPGFTIGRDDMGVDADAAPGAPIYAPLPSRLVEVLPGWYAGQPLLLFQFLQQPAGAPTDYWYVAEEINPVTTTVGTTFAAGQEVATFAPSGTGIEIGWGSPTSNSRTLAGETDPGAANPPPGATTSWGESFKKFFGIP